MSALGNVPPRNRVMFRLGRGQTVEVDADGGLIRLL